MHLGRALSLIVLTASLVSCAAKAQVRTEAELPVLDPPPPPPRVVATYPDEGELLPATPPVEPATAVRPPARTTRPESKPEPSPTAPEPAQETARPAAPISLTLTPSPGTEAQTAAAIRELLARVTRDLSRVNTASLSTDGRSQVEIARRFVQQSEDALKAGNIVFAGKLADKAATMAAVLAR